MASTRLKILLVNHSDTAGGASVVSMRLLKALGAADMDARMLVVHKQTDSLRVGEAASSRMARLPFLAEHAGIYMRNGRNRDTLFKISTASHGLPLHRHPWVREADIVVLNWINQGMLSLEGIRRIAALGKPIVWTMHDAWNMTGVCHYTAGCDSWKTGCGSCALLGSSSANDLSAKVFARKQKLYRDAGIHFVAVSHRLAQLCAQSPVMADCPVTVIPNAFPVDEFTTKPAMTRRQAGLPEGKRLVVMGAARLDDPVKNLPLAIQALNKVTTPGVVAVFYGDIRCAGLLDGLRIPYVHLGRIDDRRLLQSVMAHADVVLSTSVWETLPGTLVEGISSGALAVATGNGGQADIIEQGKTGFIVEESAEAVAAGIDAALAMPADDDSRAARHHAMAVRFAAPAVAAAYASLFASLPRKKR